MNWDHEPSAEEKALTEKSVRIQRQLNDLVHHEEQKDTDSSSQIKRVYEQAIKINTQLAEMGNIDAMHALGNLLSNEEYGFCDKDKAINWYEKAAGLGHQRSIPKLVLMYENQDPEIAEQWLEKITDETEPMLAASFYKKGYMEWMRSEYSSAMSSYSVAATLGNYDAALKLGILYKEGYKDESVQLVKPCPNMAYKYLEIAYRKEKKYCWEFEATFLYAQMLNNAKDYRQAYILFYEAATKCCGPAMVELAKIHIGDILFPANDEIAYLWLLISHRYDCGEYEEERVAMETEIEQRLNRKQKLLIPNKAEACVTMLEEQTLEDSKDLSPYILKAEDYLKEHSYLHNSEQVTEEKLAPKTVAPDQSHKKEPAFFGYKSLVPFDKDKVSLRILIKEPIKQGKSLDFEQLKVEYEGKPAQIKDMSIYTKKGIQLCEKNRKLLFKLAVAKSFADNPDETIYEILYNTTDSEGPPINTLMKKLFPGLIGSSSVISKHNGTLNIDLGFEDLDYPELIELIKDASDYKDLQELMENRKSK